jgi:tol-pal system protein YbgF
MAGCVSTPSSLGPTPQSLQLTDLEARFIRLERVLDNQSLIELANQLSSLQVEIQALRGDIDMQGFELAGTANRQRQLYVDLDDRLQSVEELIDIISSPPPIVAIAPVLPVRETPNQAIISPVQSGSDTEAYQVAYATLQRGEYPEAASSFALFLVNFPNSDLAGNAQYWLAETYYARRQYESALANFESVIRDYPNSQKIPDTLLKIGFSFDGMGMNDQALNALSTVALDYPDTTAARLALQRMERINNRQ